MSFNQSLKRRITYSFLFFGAFISAVIASGIYFALEDIETEVIENTLKEEMQYLKRSGAAQLGFEEQISAGLTRYVVRSGDEARLPELLRELATGYQEVGANGQRYYVLQEATADGQMLLVKNATTFEQREENIQIALIASVVVAVLLAWWLGASLAGRVISPVSQLAEQLSGFRPNQRQVNLAAQYAEDEVGQLAATFENYLQQIEQFIEREQAFTADASHELRTPLAVISGAAELLLETPGLPERSLRQVERIARAAERMSQMLEILLMLARETSRSPDTAYETCDVADLLLEAVEQHRPLLHDKQVQLKTQLLVAQPIVSSRTALIIVLNNLLRNAVNYTQHGEIIVTLDGLSVSIRDTGQGIAADELSHLFDRHYRGRNSQHSSGSGIGLSIVKRICDRLGWQISIESQVGEGTVVHLQLASAAPATQ